MTDTNQAPPCPEISASQRPGTRRRSPQRLETAFVSVLTIAAFGLGAGLAAASGQWLPAAMLAFSGTLITVSVRRVAQISATRRTFGR